MKPTTKRVKPGCQQEPCSPCWERGYNFDTGHSCESCGGSLYIGDNADGCNYDGNEYECHACGKHGSMTVYEDGEVCGHEFDEENASVMARPDGGLYT